MLNLISTSTSIYQGIFLIFNLFIYFSLLFYSGKIYIIMFFLKIIVIAILGKIMFTDETSPTNLTDLKTKFRYLCTKMFILVYFNSKKIRNNLNAYH